ncbi:MAG: 30S ribosomal protein S17 [Chloroflexi bacterium]|jgi:small subunit ribosomal protein S17|nr:MAG: 30S ribosomal protein S17 [Chloroflexota bacterium]TMC21549.1 MAG: 30S ribosomal protein S17 [Chloroflexota bacterium]TMC39279.1 MAG: 30S ribosomal protein S17 [Chloroflexota bacterium]TMC95044.1 MAG: 30S ribosomal protein S17 [Chloroflexota bacterium]TMC99579.1 MAG: 30S ribosomal protein S17 [Chloroflexota bacterium]
MTQQSVTSTQQVATPKKGRRQQRVGRVVSNKMNKTIVVVVETLKKHRIYKRTYKQTKRFQAHDEENICQIGDLVRIEECRPLSKMKRWRLIEIIKPSSGIVPVEEVLAEADPDLSSEESESDESDESDEAEE